jgi:hypothetical protein
MIFHQNIREICNTTNELLNLWLTELPHILCFTEHHLQDEKINNMYINLAGKTVNLEGPAYMFTNPYRFQL